MTSPRTLRPVRQRPRFPARRRQKPARWKASWWSPSRANNPRPDGVLLKRNLTGGDAGCGRRPRAVAGGVLPRPRAVVFFPPGWHKGRAARAERSLRDMADDTPRDIIWETIRAEAAEGVWREPMLSSFLHASILNHHSLEDALCFILAHKLERRDAARPVPARPDVDAHRADPTGDCARADLEAVRQRDPACRKYSSRFSISRDACRSGHRIAHHYWNQERAHGALPPEPGLRGLRHGHPPRRPHRKGRVHGSRHGRGHRRDRRGGGQRVHAARRHPRRHRQGVGGPPLPKGGQGRAHRGGRENPRKHRDRRGRENRGGCRGAQARAAPHHRGGRAARPIGPTDSDEPALDMDQQLGETSFCPPVCGRPASKCDCIYCPNPDEEHPPRNP